MLTDEQQRKLIELARRGSPSERKRALEQLLADFRGPALAAIHKALASSGVGYEQAEEVLQAAILKFLESGLERYGGDAAPRTYFVRIAVNAAVDLIRRTRKRIHEVIDDSKAQAEALVKPPLQEERLLAAEKRAAFQECLEQLLERYHSALSAYYFGSAADCATCAKKFGLKKNTFEKLLSRARMALAECIRRKLR